MVYRIEGFSSLGHVAMIVPVITSVSKRYAEHTFVVVAQKRLEDMFYGLDNVQFHTDAESEDSFDVRINIGESRWGQLKKWLQTWPGNTNQQPAEAQRVAQIFRSFGLESDEMFEQIPVNPIAEQKINQLYAKTDSAKWIGIAPFAKNKSNMLPYRQTKELIQYYSTLPNTRVFLFGAGKIEQEMLRQWAETFPNVESVAGKLTLGEELELMRKLDVMACMDSANQHLSSLVKLRAVSIWCATDPKLGFYGWKQNPDDCVALPHLRCKPCTVHGGKRCLFRNFACQNIPIKLIIDKIG